jgi:hypothetical protein
MSPRNEGVAPACVAGTHERAARRLRGRTHNGRTSQERGT